MKYLKMFCDDLYHADDMDYWNKTNTTKRVKIYSLCRKVFGFIIFIMDTLMGIWIMETYLDFLVGFATGDLLSIPNINEFVNIISSREVYVILYPIILMFFIFIPLIKWSLHGVVDIYNSAKYIPILFVLFFPLLELTMKSQIDIVFVLILVLIFKVILISLSKRLFKIDRIAHGNVLKNSMCGAMQMKGEDIDE